MKQLLETFANPGSAFRGKPFWAWNGRLDPEELRRQIRVMHRMGLGGGFMHSRVGLNTPYLSDTWFDCVRACIDECDKLGMEAWLYDEDRWPSGAAGGLVTKNPKYRARKLMLHRYDVPGDFVWHADTVAAFKARMDGDRLLSCARLNRRTRCQGVSGSILEFREELDACSSWYNDYTYLDTLNDEAVREFIRVTHERYREECGDAFGKTVPGIFTDEPNYGTAFSPHPGIEGAPPLPAVPWTGRLRKVFRERYGYDIVPQLPRIFFDAADGGFPKARYHYFDCITHLFVDAFARQIGEWCDANGLRHTGHVLCEDTLTSQTSVAGSCMRFYEYMQAPGMDLLTEKWRIYDTAKQVSSAARQFDRKWRLTETYGCTGWDFPFAGHKALGDWQVALGINLRCQHLSWYTMAGEAKRDYPAGIFYHSPWWEVYSKVEDYFARILSVMTRGREVRDLLVIHPNESMWTRFRVGHVQDPAVAGLDQMIVDLRDTLLRQNIDFDYGDEELLSRHARIRKGPDGPRFIVGKADYTTVLVPPLITIRATTLKLLERFVKAGGRVVFAGDVPGVVDCEPSDRAAALATACPRAPARGKRLADAVAACRRVSIADAAGRQIDPALYLLREDADNAYLFVCNTGLSPAQSREPQMDSVFVRDRRAAFADVRISGMDGFQGHPVELDPDTGERFAARAGRTKHGWEIRSSLPALGSRLFVIPKRRQRALPAARPVRKPVRERRLSGLWDWEMNEPNVLLLDQPAFRVGGGRWQRPGHVLLADYAIRDALGIPRRGGQMVQPWARVKQAETASTPVRLKYSFTVQQRPNRALFLALEQPERFAIRLNGHGVDANAEAGWWVDQSCRKLSLAPGMLREGENVLELSCDYSADGPELEHVYLLGDFGVRLQQHRPVVTGLGSKLKTGDWVRQGLPFYSGAVTYRRRVKAPQLRKGERLFVGVPSYCGAVVRVWCGSEVAGVVAWEPNEVDVTDHMADGFVDLGIEVISHRRNSHGPVHMRDQWPAWHGPAQFVAGHEREPRYYPVPCGLMDAPVLRVAR